MGLLTNGARTSCGIRPAGSRCYARLYVGNRPIMVRLLLSIDRREGMRDALDTVALAAEYQSQGVVGIDLSGNPSIGSLATWLPALHKARELGLMLTLHAAEVLRPAETFVGVSRVRTYHACRGQAGICMAAKLLGALCRCSGRKRLLRCWRCAPNGLATCAAWMPPWSSRCWTQTSLLSSASPAMSSQKAWLAIQTITLGSCMRPVGGHTTCLAPTLLYRRSVSWRKSQSQCGPT